jgi:3-hydroxybutyryl-CoA dehydrogenase
LRGARLAGAQRSLTIETLGEVPDPCTPYSTASRPIDWSITTDEQAREQGELVRDRLAIAGSGAIACGLAATAAHHGPVLLLARSTSSARRARGEVERALARAKAIVDPEHVQIVTEPGEVAGATFVVEAVVEDHDVKAGLLSELGAIVADDAILASTTSSLSIERLAQESGRPERFVGLHVFNPVAQMQLVEVIFPAAAGEDTRARALALCETFEKTPVEVPDVPGFVVNRLLFPYLFSAVRLLEETGMEASDVDTCMRLGAGHPMGPLALLDLVGLDVAKAIGEALGERLPARVEELLSAGALGRKSGRGFHSYREI